MRGSSGRSSGPPPRVHLNRALSKLGILTRSQANDAILAGRVTVNGRIVRDPAHRVVAATARIAVDDETRTAAVWRTLMFHKPRGVMTTRRDPEGRRTIYDVIGAEAEGLVPVGRLDLATSGLLLMTSDTALASWIENPSNAVPRTYVVTVRGEVSDTEVQAMIAGVTDRGEPLKAAAVTLRKRSKRESHLTITLTEGRNREIRRLCAALGHQVTRLKRVQIGDLALGDLAPGAVRSLTRREVAEKLTRVHGAAVRAHRHTTDGRDMKTRDWRLL